MPRSAAGSGDDEANRARLEKDARFLECLRLEQWKTNEHQVSHLCEEARRNVARADELEQLAPRCPESAGRNPESPDDVQGDRHRIQSQLIESEQKLILAQQSEIQAWHRTNDLRDRLARFEGHPVLGAALRGRRRLRRLIQSVGEGISAPNGSRQS